MVKYPWQDLSLLRHSFYFVDVVCQSLCKNGSDVVPQLRKRPFSHPRVEIRSPNKEGCQGSWISPSMTNIIVCFPSPQKAFRNCFALLSFSESKQLLIFGFFFCSFPNESPFHGGDAKRLLLACVTGIFMGYCHCLSTNFFKRSWKVNCWCSHLTSYSLDFRWWFGADWARFSA